ncbi:MAG: prepilin-type N-terminal cleavage/methylation domain-containing protein [Candidatus Lustribacter sp.]
MRRDEAGFTLIEMIVVTAILVIVAGTLGTFFLAGASPAVAAAQRDVNAAFDEARRTAVAYDAATVVFTPALSGGGFSARVYQRQPGDPQFRARNGPEYGSSVTIGETASPLGAPAFAFALDSSGTVTGFANFVAGAAAYAARPCPASGAFTLLLAYDRDTRSVTIPCTLVPSNSTPPAVQTPAPAFTATPAPAPACPSGMTCNLTGVTPAPNATCPSGYALDAAVPGLCDGVVAPPPAPTGTPSAAPTGTPGPSSTPAGTPVPSATPAGMIEQYTATADEFAPHTATLFADGSICDDDGCSLIGAIVWSWACPAGALSGSSGNDGSNYPYQPDNAYDGAVSSMIADADHNAAEGDGDGRVYTNDSYCAGFTTPHP